MTDDKFKKGDQVAWVPIFAKGNINHPAVEHGFVMGRHWGETYLCRFWWRGQVGELLTETYSQPVEASELQPCEYCEQSIVDEFIRMIDQKIGKYA